MKYRIFDKTAKKFISDEIEAPEEGLAVGLNGEVVTSKCNRCTLSCEPYYFSTLEDIGREYIAQQSTGFFHNGVEVWEGDLFEREGAILKVEYCIKNATYMLSTKQGHVWNVMFLPYLKAYESIVDYIGNVLTHPELWEVAE